MTLFPIDSGWGCAGNDYEYDYIEIPLTSNRVANFEAEALRNEAFIKFILRINLCQNVLEPADFDGLIMPGFIYLFIFL